MLEIGLGRLISADNYRHKSRLGVIGLSGLPRLLWTKKPYDKSPHILKRH